MDHATVREMSDSFLAALQVGGEARRLVDYQLSQYAELLPEPDTWAVLGRGEMAALVLLAGDALLTISRGPTAEEESQVVVTWNPVRVAEITHRRDDERTFWEFQLRARNPLLVEGRVNYPSAPDARMTFDQAELFARALAARCGWPTPGQESFHVKAPSSDESPGADSSRLSRPSRQPVTDLWGNPKPRRRKR